jgi:hypothetical protein
MLRERVGLGVLIAISGLGVCGSAAQEAPRCRRVHATIDLSEGTIQGNAGLDGSASFTSDGSGTPPETAPAGSSVFSGILAIGTDEGDLELRETGMFSARTDDPAGPVLASFGEVQAGTGRFEGATGDLFFAGRNDAAGVFVVAVSGTLCR